MHEAELHLPEALAAQLGIQVRGPQALLLDLLLQRLAARRRPSQPSSSMSVSSGHTCSRTKPRIHSSLASNSGSVEKSQGIGGSTHTLLHRATFG